MRVLRLVAIAFTIAAAILVGRLHLSRDLTELFPKTPEAAMLARVTRAFGGGDVALVLVTGADPDDVRGAAEDATKRLALLETVGQVVASAPAAPRSVDPTTAWRWAGPIAREKLARAVSEAGMRERLRETRGLLLAPGAGEVEAWIARDPLRLSSIPWEGTMELAAGARAAPGEPFATADGTSRLLVLEPKGHAFDAREAARFVDGAEAALDEARRLHPSSKLVMTGGHVVAKQTERMMKDDLVKSSVVSLVLAALAFLVTFRRVRALVAVLPPLAIGTLWTTALAAVTYPRLSAIASAFAAVVIGVGVDTGVHVYGKLLDARRAGLSGATAAAFARRATWKPTMGAALAAAGAFGSLLLSDVEGMRQLGLLCGAGEVLTAVAILVVVPDLGAWLERNAVTKPLRLPFVAALTRTRPRAALALALAAAVVLVAAAMGSPRLDHGIVATGTGAIEAMRTYEEIYAKFGGTRGQLMVVSADKDPARASARADAVAETAEQIVAEGDAVGFDSASRLAPSTAAVRARYAARDALDLPGRSALLERALREEGFDSRAFGPALDAFDHPARADAAGGPEDDPTLAWIRRRHVATDDDGTMVVTFVRLTGDPRRDAMARAGLKAADPGAVLTGFAELESSLRDTLARDLPRVLVAAAGLVVMVLAGTLRSVRAVALAALVLVVEVAIVAIASHALEVRWHIYDALVLPVLLGITLDEAMFLLEAEQRAVDTDDDPIERALAEQAPLASATALTTAAGFGALVVCRFGGLVDVGKVGALGSIAGLVAALVVIPAGLRLLGPRIRTRAG